MITITVKWDVKPEYADQFMELTREFTEACRAEPGCLWFDWSRRFLNKYLLLYSMGNIWDVEIEVFAFESTQIEIFSLKCRQGRPNQKIPRSRSRA